MRKYFYGYRLGQSFLEYTITFVVVAAALVAMSKYINNSVNARLNQIRTELSDTAR